MSIEGTANTEYASLSGKIRTFVVDKSLTVSGACADAKATGDKIDNLIDDAATAGEEAANKAMSNFLDSTLTKSDKAAPASSVGEVNERLGTLRGEFDETWKMEKIADVTLAEDVTGFYIELPKTLSKYEYILMKATGVYSSTTNNTSAYAYAVDSLTSTSTSSLFWHFARMAQGGYTSSESVAVLYPLVNASGGVTCVTQETRVPLSTLFEDRKFSCLDTKYLYVNTGDSNAILSGAHFEMWGVAK